MKLLLVISVLLGGEAERDLKGGPFRYSLPGQAY